MEQFNTAGTPRDCPVCNRRGSLRLLRRKPEIYECGSGEPTRARSMADAIDHATGCFALFRFGPVREGGVDVLTRIAPLAVRALTEAELRVVRGDL